MFADSEIINRAVFVGYLLGVRKHRELGDRAAVVDPETVAGMLKDVVQDVASRLTSQDELNQLNGRVVKRGEQPGKANF